MHIPVYSNCCYQHWLCSSVSKTAVALEFKGLDMISFFSRVFISKWHPGNFTAYLT